VATSPLRFPASWNYQNQWVSGFILS